MTGQNVILSDKDIEMLQRMKKGKYVDPEYDPYKVRKYGFQKKIYRSNIKMK